MKKLVSFVSCLMSVVMVLCLTQTVCFAAEDLSVKKSLEKNSMTNFFQRMSTQSIRTGIFLFVIPQK